MKKYLLIAVAACALSSGAATAASLQLDYTAVPTTGNLYHYNFSLKLLNQDNSWTPGQQWDWIIFGDGAGARSPIADFQNFQSTDPMVGLTSSGGGHSGPTLQYGTSVVLPGWQPAAVGSTLNWSGDSATFLGEGQLVFSTIISGNGGVRSDFQVANFVNTAVPEPATWLMMIAGFGLVGGVMRRRSTKIAFA